MGTSARPLTHLGSSWQMKQRSRSGHTVFFEMHWMGSTTACQIRIEWHGLNEIFWLMSPFWKRKGLERSSERIFPANKCHTYENTPQILEDPLCLSINIYALTSLEEKRLEKVISTFLRQKNVILKGALFGYFDSIPAEIIQESKSGEIMR